MGIARYDNDVTFAGPKEPSQRAMEDREAAQTRERQRLAREVCNDYSHDV